MQVDASGHMIAIEPTIVPFGLVPLSGDFDSLKLLPLSTPLSREYIGTFHIDLSLSQSGTSDPFQLALSSFPGTALISNVSYESDQSAHLSLTGVTLPDGTSLASAGYGVSFASGLLSDPSQVPEPTSLACWALAGLGACRLIRRRGSRPPIK